MFGKEVSNNLIVCRTIGNNLEINIAVQVAIFYGELQGPKGILFSE